MDSAELIKQSLFALTGRGIKYDLERISDASSRTGNFHNRYSSFHVAGTNGKGSTCAFIESVLRTAGFRTGLFTSPHIRSFEERFKIDGEEIEENEWVETYYRQREIIETCRCTFFEATMLIAMEIFHNHRIDWAVFETGLGGRLDATNIITPEVSVITRIAMDHREFLGSTLKEIAGEKLGIVKESIPLVITRPREPEIVKFIEETCAARNAPVNFVTDTDATDVEETGSGNLFTYRETRFSTRLPGRFQVLNATLAIEALLRSKTGPHLGDSLSRGIEAALLPGRFQRLRRAGKEIVIDVGHNPDAASVLCMTLRHLFPGGSICFVVGIMRDKDFPEMLGLYATVADHIVLTRPKTDRAAQAELLARYVPEDRHSICPDAGAAVRLALRRPEEVVCITGSFYTVGEAMEIIGPGKA